MNKIKIEPKYAPFPKPIALVGCLVNDKPNFMNIAWFNRISMVPNMWLLSLNKHHHTAKGILKHKELSINIPHPAVVTETDFCGLVSGKEIDKSKLFKIFYGELKNAPMIENYPINIELTVEELEEKWEQLLLFCKVKNIYTKEEYLTEGELDPVKFNPLAFIKPNPEGFYYVLGDKVGKAWSVGKKLMNP